MDSIHVLIVPSMGIDSHFDCILHEDQFTCWLYPSWGSIHILIVSSMGIDSHFVSILHEDQFTCWLHPPWRSIHILIVSSMGIDSHFDCFSVIDSCIDCIILTGFDSHVDYIEPLRYFKVVFFLCEFLLKRRWSFYCYKDLSRINCLLSLSLSPTWYIIGAQTE